DYPPQARERQRVTRDALPAGLSAREIDRAVRERTLAGEAIYELDRDALAAAQPDLIVTQALCPVCAVSYEDVALLARELRTRPRVIALDPETLGETQADVRTLAEATGRSAEGARLVAQAAARTDAVRQAVRGRPGPRLTEGVELLGHILHPECLPSAPAAARALAVEPLTVAG